MKKIIAKILTFFSLAKDKKTQTQDIDLSVHNQYMSEISKATTDNITILGKGTEILRIDVASHKEFEEIISSFSDVDNNFKVLVYDHELEGKKIKEINDEYQKRGLSNKIYATGSDAFNFVGFLKDHQFILSLPIGWMLGHLLQDVDDLAWMYVKGKIKEIISKFLPKFKNKKGFLLVIDSNSFNEPKILFFFPNNLDDENLEIASTSILDVVSQTIEENKTKGLYSYDYRYNIKNKKWSLVNNG